jgi:hypothetical protein
MRTGAWLIAACPSPLKKAKIYDIPEGPDAHVLRRCHGRVQVFNSPTLSRRASRCFSFLEPLLYLACREWRGSMGKGTATSPKGWAKTSNSRMDRKSLRKSTAKPYVKDAFLELSSLYRN